VPTCRVCPAEIVWATSERTGNPVPVNAERNRLGNVVLEHRTVGEPPVAKFLTHQEVEEHRKQARQRVEKLGHAEQDTWLFVEHHATCPAVARVRCGELVGQAALF
jgi:hypothetical protein